MDIIPYNQLNKKSFKKIESNGFISDSPKQSRPIREDLIEERKEYRLSSHLKSSSSDLEQEESEQE